MRRRFAVQETENAFSNAMYKISSLNKCVSHIKIKNTNSSIFLCRPWENIFLWANLVSDKHLPNDGSKITGHFASLNYCISGRCEVRLPDDTYIYMVPGMLCIDDHKSQYGYNYPSGGYTGLEIVFNLDGISERPIAELSAYGDFARWIKDMLESHNGSYLAKVDNKCDKLMNLMYFHLTGADWEMEDYKMHLLLLLYMISNGGTVSMTNHFYVTRGQKYIVDEVEKMVTKDLSLHYTITDMADKYGISPSALKKYFEAVYGLPISFYIKEKRIILAKQRLTETKDSIGAIAADCGYANQGKFGSAFKGVTGLSPLEYRRLNYIEKKGGENNEKA